MLPLGSARLTRARVRRSAGALALRGLAAALLAAAGAGGPTAAHAAAGDPARVLVDDVDVELRGGGAAPSVVLAFRVLDGEGRPLDVARDDLGLHRDGEAVAPDRVDSLARAGDAGAGVAGVLVLDASPAMRGAPFETAREAALAFVDALGPEDRFALVTFDAAAHVAVPFGTGRAEARGRLEGLDGPPPPDDPGAGAAPRDEPASALLDGAHRALALVRGRPGISRHAFVALLASGREAGSRRTIEQVIALARGGRGSPRIPVFAALLAAGSAGGDPDRLERLATATGGGRIGESGESDASEDPTRLVLHALAQMRGAHVLRFRAAMDGEAHRIGLAVAGHEDERSVRYPNVDAAAAAEPAGGPGLARPLAAVVALLAAGGALVAVWAARRRGPGLRLRFLNGPLEGRVVPLSPGRLRLGALVDNDVAIPADTVSRAHAEIRVSRTGATIVDLGSTNGTRINRRPVRTHTLAAGDRIALGEVEAVIEG